VRVLLLEHRGGNLGHDFMALGVRQIIAQSFQPTPVVFRSLEQHRPFEVLGRHHPARVLNLLRAGRTQRLKFLIAKSTVIQSLWRSAAWVREFDVAVACGGPNLVAGAWRAPDMRLMLHFMHGAITSHGVPLLNLSNGSCFPWEQKADAVLEPSDVSFWRRALGLASVTTVRDSLAESILHTQVGAACPLVACPALNVWGGETAADEGRYVIVNFLPRGANNDWGQGVDQMSWAETVRRLVRRLRGRYDVLFLCHNRAELSAAGEVCPDVPRVLPRDVDEYRRVIEGAIAGLCCRIHAAVPLASLCVPSIGIGTDSRLLTLAAFGLRTVYVKEASAEQLEEELEAIIATRKIERERLHAARSLAVEQYGTIVKTYTRG
jgi:hypothetical protein